MPIWENTKLYDRILQLLNQRERGYVKFNKARENIINLMRPDMGSDIDPDGDGSFFGEDIYDGVGSWAVGVMSRGFQGGLVSADADWLAHEAGDGVLDEVDEISIWLQEIDDHMTNVYQKSNFYRVLPMFTKDGISIGSPLMFVEETDIVAGVVTFLPQHYTTVFAFYDGNNKLEGVIIKDENWTVKKITDKFAPTEEEQKAKLPKMINNNIRDGKFYEEHTMYRAVFKGDNPVWDVEGFDKPGAEWVSVYFIEKTPDDQKNNPLSTEQYFTRPFVTWDYDKKPWESISRTPAFEAIHDVLSQQEMALDQATNRKLKNNPPRAVLEDHRNIVDFNPEGITPVAKGDWGNLPTAIDVVGDIRLSREEMEFNAERVKRWFLTDQFLKFTDLTNTLRQQPTATQIIKIAAELSVQVNPGIATFTTGFLADVDERMMDIEIRAGRGPFNPARMEDISQIIQSIADEFGAVTTISLTPVFTGPLARAQKVKQELDPILEGLGVAGTMFEVWPELKNAVREHGTLERVFKATGFPLQEFKSEDEYNEIVAAIREAEAAAIAQQQQIEMIKASKNLQGPVDETSIASQAQEALA
jgi:hypothetical protein